MHLPKMPRRVLTVESTPMTSPPPPGAPATAAAPIPDIHTASVPGLRDPQSLLHDCYAMYRARMVEMARNSLELTGDLFESGSHVPDGEVEAFKNRRGDWLALFERTLAERFALRIGGERRQGRRLDADASLATLRVLTGFDHERQAALKAATQLLERFTRRELAALDARVDLLLPDTSRRDTDNPFAVSYILDALGGSARAVYPSPRVWRPFMERVLADITPGINKLYISINRFLADHGVLPEIKAALRARSEHRPQDDKDLLPTFSKMLHEAGRAVPADIAVPDLPAMPGTPPPLVFADRPPAGAAEQPGVTMSTARILAGLAALAAATPAPAPAADPDAAFFPPLDPLMALGTSSPLFATLAQWQCLDLPAALANAAPDRADRAVPDIVPRNLVPHIRAAIDSQIASDTDWITMDVIALLFDYVFRDPSIPDGMRRLFGRLQVPIVKAALLDRTFFSDRQHAARQLLDHLAEAAVGANADDGDRDGFVALATDVVESICRDFEIDLEVFAAQDARLVPHLERERMRVAHALSADVEDALAAEAREGDRAIVLALLRDRLAGVEVPFEVRAFVETVWADHLTTLRQQHGPDSDAWNAGVRTLDDMLWSIVAKERTAQKARLTRMIPALIGALRQGCTARGVPPDRAGAFFDALYGLHMSAIRPEPDAGAASPAPSAPEAALPETPASSAARRGSEILVTPVGPLPASASAPLPLSATAATTPAADRAATSPPARSRPAVNVHDYVSEMPVGTWLAFEDGGTAVSARLSWVSPLRTKYLFTSRTRSRAFVYTPEELAWGLGAGNVNVVVEPVPLFDRAVSAALDSLAARRPAESGPLAA
jgi:hypothetical protein